MSKPRNPSVPWRPPTRRVFVSMLGAAAAAIALGDPLRRAIDDAIEPTADPPRSTWTGKTRWIGHC